ncbi:MAG TPA: DUF4347 domain-containing protein [Polyangia bacterium]|nr:DUF4347 domain-containing protein [Polyangia bacterium]
MPTVWAHRNNTGRWESDAQHTGWSHRIEFTTLRDLVQKLTGSKPSLNGQVTKLAIVAHGDSPGVVQLEPTLTVATAHSFESEFLQLNQLLISYGRLIFFSCIAGAHDAGSQLLNLLSARFFPHRYVIGFEVLGGIAPRGAANYPGDVDAVLNAPLAPPTYPPAGPDTKSPRLSEYSWFAKWSLDGRVIRRSLQDQSAPEKREQKAIGMAAAESAIRSHAGDVTSVVIESDHVRAKVSGLSHPLLRGKIRVEGRREIDALAAGKRHQGIVVVWTAYVYSYRCADPRCPGHASQWHFCESFVAGLPNGPLR